MNRLRKYNEFIVVSNLSSGLLEKLSGAHVKIDPYINGTRPDLFIEYNGNTYIIEVTGSVLNEDLPMGTVSTIFEIKNRIQPTKFIFISLSNISHEVLEFLKNYEVEAFEYDEQFAIDRITEIIKSNEIIHKRVSFGNFFGENMNNYLSSNIIELKSEPIIYLEDNIYFQTTDKNWLNRIYSCNLVFSKKAIGKNDTTLIEYKYPLSMGSLISKYDRFPILKSTRKISFKEFGEKPPSIEVKKWVVKIDLEGNLDFETSESIIVNCVIYAK